MHDLDPDRPAGTDDGLFGMSHRAEDAAVHVYGVPFEATTSFGRGTAGGPEAVAEASLQLQIDLYDPELGGGAAKAGIHMLPTDRRIPRWNEQASELALPVIAAGGPGDDLSLHRAVAQVDELGDKVNETVETATWRILTSGRIPAILGGDHAVPYGAIRAAARRHPGLGLLHIDAHADLRQAHGGFTWSHASILFNVLTRIPEVGPVCQVGLRDFGQSEARFARADSRVHWFTDAELAWERSKGVAWREQCRRILSHLPDTLWITLDIDGLDPALCPNTGTPVPGGLSWHDVMGLMRLLLESGRTVVGFDLVEVGQQPWDARVGARLLYKLSSLAVASRG